jgi:hypothetical protein
VELGPAWFVRRIVGSAVERVPAELAGGFHVLGRGGSRGFRVGIAQRRDRPACGSRAERLKARPHRVVAQRNVQGPHGEPFVETHRSPGDVRSDDDNDDAEGLAHSDDRSEPTAHQRPEPASHSDNSSEPATATSTSTSTSTTTTTTSATAAAPSDRGDGAHGEGVLQRGRDRSAGGFGLGPQQIFVCGQVRGAAQC